MEKFPRPVGAEYGDSLPRTARVRNELTKRGGGRWTIAAEYVETESGRRSDRPKLKTALAHAKAIKAKLVFAKLDRLTRSVDLLRSLVASDVDLVFCDLPNVPSEPMGRFLWPL